MNDRLQTNPDAAPTRFAAHDSTMPVAQGVQRILLGVDVVIRYDRLRDYCSQHLDGVDVDLMLLAGVVAFVDRAVRRVRSHGWCRVLQITMSVHDPDCWERPEVKESLQEALKFLTGDSWQFAFVARRTQDDRALQLHLPIDRSVKIVMPYSGGLDSFAGLVGFLRRTPNERVMLVTAEMGNAATKLIQSTVQAAGGHLRSEVVGVPLRMHTIHHAEESYRTRAFLFTTLAAIASRLTGNLDVIVPENGIGAIGPSLVPFSTEHPHRAAHPGFTLRLAEFLRTLRRTPPKFAFPHLWKTKGEVLHDLAGHGLEGWQASRSCSRNPARAKKGSNSHCGICGGCLLRRIALHAGLGSVVGSQERYVWQNLGAADLSQACDLNATNIQTTDNDVEIAAYAVLSAKDLADQADDKVPSVDVERVASELSHCGEGNAGEVAARIVRLLRTHAKEWSGFLSSFGENGWISQVGGKDK